MCLWLHVKSAINLDVIIWVYRYYIVQMLNIFVEWLTYPFFDVTIMLVWRVPSWSGCRVVWRVVSLCWLERIVGWVHWSSANRSITSVVVALACRMTPNSSLTFFCCMFLITAWYAPDYHIRVYYWECVKPMPR